MCCLDASAASDNRTIVTEVKAVSNIADILGYGKERRLPTFTIIEGTAAHVDYNTVHWEKKNANGEWEAYKEAVFSEGIYRVCAFWLIDGEYGTTHKLDQYWTLTVDDEVWATSQANVTDTRSLGSSESPEMVVERQEVNLVSANCEPTITEIVGYGKETIRPTITLTEGLVANIPEQMVKWWKRNDSGEWEIYDKNIFTEGYYYLGLQVRIDGEYGSTHVLASDWKLIINDDQLWHTEKPTVGSDYSYGFAHSSDVLVIKEVPSVAATSDISDIIGLGKETKRPTYTMSEGSEMHIDGMEINGVNLFWWKKNAEDKWGIYEGNVFTEGTYRAYVQTRANNEWYVLAEDWTLTVDSEVWETETPETDNFGSYGWAWSPEIIVGESGIQAIIADNSTKADIYNLQGIIIKHNASEKDLHSLPAGIYIMNGKKVVVK